MIGVIDAGLGNIGSLLNMLDRVGAPARTVTSAAELAAVDRLILPGVGAFDTGMSRLAAAGLVEPLRARVLHERVPLLGVCLGMQLLTRASEEGSLPGLGLVAATTRRFAFPAGEKPLRLPHMGWNECRPAPGARLIAAEGEELPRFYFVHTFHVVCDDPALTAGTTHYGYEFTAALQAGPIFGVQFHPEKSHRWGKALLERFARLA